MNKVSVSVIALICFLSAGFCQSHPAGEKTFVVAANQIKATIQPTMWGIFFEDINMAADGGVYAELVKNRSFEFNNPLMGWKELKMGAASGTVLVLNRSEVNPNNPRYIRVTRYGGDGGA